MKKNKTQQQFHSEREEILESERKKSFNFQNRERFLLPALLRFVAIARVKIIDQTKPTISKLQPCHRRHTPVVAPPDPFTADFWFFSSTRVTGSLKLETHNGKKKRKKV
jgi:hypothetical protein